MPLHALLSARPIYALALLTLAACASDSSSLAVDVRTDLVVGIEFSSLEIAFEGQREVRFADTTDDFATGVRVARFEDIASGRASGELIVRLSGTEVLSRPFQVLIDRPTQVVTLVVSRDCRGVECPNSGSATATACLAGRCADPTCSEENPEACPPEARCASASDCPSRADCSVAECRGVCVYLDRRTCGDFQYCDPESGCVDRPGAPDAGLDAAMDADARPDAGPDAGPDASCAEGATRPCYEGPIGTAEVGICESGTQICSGGEWDPSCVGQTLPATDVCGDDVDQDCNGASDDGAECCAPDEEQVCYDGPASTRSVGDCRPGTQTCASGVFGECEGQVLPRDREECGTVGDEDCDGLVDEDCCPFGGGPTCCANVADGESETRCNMTLRDMVNLCTDSGRRWTGPAACRIGGSASCGACWGAQGCCDE